KRGKTIDAVLPKSIGERVRALLDDPKLLEISDSVALMQERQLQLCERLESEESGAIWEALKKTWGEFESANLAARQASEALGEAKAQLAEAQAQNDGAGMALAAQIASDAQQRLS